MTQLSSANLIRTIGTFVLLWAMSIVNSTQVYNHLDVLKKFSLNKTELEWKIILYATIAFGVVTIIYTLYVAKHIFCQACEGAFDCLTKITCLRFLLGTIFYLALLSGLGVIGFIGYRFYENIEYFHHIQNNFPYVWICYLSLTIGTCVITLLHIVTYMTECLKCITCNYCCCPKKKEEEKLNQRKEFKYEGIKKNKRYSYSMNLIDYDDYQV